MSYGNCPMCQSMGECSEYCILETLKRQRDEEHMRMLSAERQCRSLERQRDGALERVSELEERMLILWRLCWGAPEEPTPDEAFVLIRNYINIMHHEVTEDVARIRELNRKLAEFVAPSRHRITDVPAGMASVTSEEYIGNPGAVLDRAREEPVAVLNADGSVWGIVSVP